MLRRLDSRDLSKLFQALQSKGYEVVGPTEIDGAVCYAPIDGPKDLPRGRIEEQGPGRYRLTESGNGAYFDHVVGPHAWKRYLNPPEQKLFSATGGDAALSIHALDEVPPKRAFLGVRSCDLAAIEILDKVFENGTFSDAGYVSRRASSLVIAVNCGRAGDTCFCVSMETGPRAKAGFDIAMTELVDTDSNCFVIEAGTDIGKEILKQLDLQPVTESETRAAERRISEAAQNMGREMIADAADVLKRNLDSPYWDTIAERCLNCANCTMACPTCFCSTVEDTTDLSGEHAERWRKWDSCFTVDFSYIHGGSLRQSGGARYRQWATHKLSHWHDQFGSSGCVGCGRCITWCPVGIDITEEARNIKDLERKG
ncbi:MAG: 4Fe-4S dicluster domain-containing protein [Rhodospirillaceae bacterium]|nr:4Fe-4S dicluster domain-containing protein [Rhodospirillaceae bacterium]